MEKFERKSKIQNLLLRSVRKGHLGNIDQILNSGANINGLVNSRKCPLAESANGEVARFLIARGADVKHVKCVTQKRCQSPLIKVLNRRDYFNNSLVGVIQVLLENGASVNDKCGDKKTPLMLAAEKEGNLSVLQVLLDHGAVLGEVNKEGNTALVHAASKGCFQNVSLLLQFITNKREAINLQNGAGLTALMYAGRFVYIKPVMIKELIDYGGDVNIKDKKGNTALLHLPLVSVEDEDEIVKSLYQAGCDINVQNDDGLSPLMVAAQDCLKDRMCSLLNVGAEINAASRSDATKTALSYLLYKSRHEQNYFKCLTYLLDRGAHASYLDAAALHRMILLDQIHVVARLIWCGLGPAGVFISCKLSLSPELYNVMREYRMLSSTYETDITEYFSPLGAALCAGNSVLARFFVRNLFLTHYDISSLSHNTLLRQHLKRHIRYQKCLDILNEISIQPMSLFNLSFVAVTAAVGARPGREIRVSKLPLPELIKEKLLFKCYTKYHFNSKRY